MASMRASAVATVRTPPNAADRRTNTPTGTTNAYSIPNGSSTAETATLPVAALAAPRACRARTDASATASRPAGIRRLRGGIGERSR
jgi:hypothetical protein